jgi:hypothetical protein
MLRPAATALLGFGVALTGGCADLMQRSTIAPEWFQAKAVEVKGEGYPDLAEIPTAQEIAGSQEGWEAEAAALKAEVAEIQAAAGPDEPVPTDDEIRAKAAQLRALLENGRAPADAGEP